MLNEKFLTDKLQIRVDGNALRTLQVSEGKVDFCSNDYLGIATNHLLHPDPAFKHGSGGSRLLSGNYPLIEEVEIELATFYRSQASLIFNSGYDANMGLLSCVPQRGDVIFYDKLIHASIRDGIKLSHAQAYAYQHNDLNDLEHKLRAQNITEGKNIFVLTESVFSMDGDMAPLAELSILCEQIGALLIVDEAHATGVVGEHGEGLVQYLKLENKVFARIHTFGKGCGCHGAVVLGSTNLRSYLINFSRAFIYTTSLPETAIAAIQISHRIFPGMHEERAHLASLITLFQNADHSFHVLRSHTAIQVMIIPGNDVVKAFAFKLQSKGYDIRAILYPTVPKGAERLRIVLHSFNTADQVTALIQLLKG